MKISVHGSLSCSESTFVIKKATIQTQINMAVKLSFYDISVRLK